MAISLKRYVILIAAGLSLAGCSSVLNGVPTGISIPAGCKSQVMASFGAAAISAGANVTIDEQCDETGAVVAPPGMSLAPRMSVAPVLPPSGVRIELR